MKTMSSIEDRWLTSWKHCQWRQLIENRFSSIVVREKKMLRLFKSSNNGSSGGLCRSTDLPLITFLPFANEVLFALKLSTLSLPSLVLSLSLLHFIVFITFSVTVGRFSIFRPTTPFNFLVHKTAFTSFATLIPVSICLVGLTFFVLFDSFTPFRPFHSL